MTGETPLSRQSTLRKWMTGSVVLSILVLLGLTTATQAAVVVYTSRAHWEEAVAGEMVIDEDFERFAADEDFRPFPIVAEITNGTIGQVPNFRDEEFRNKIDVPPLETTDNNGTSHAACFVDGPEFKSDDGIRVEIIFSDAVGAWGADFNGAGSGDGVEIDIMAPDGTTVGTIGLVPDTGFYGFVLDAGELVGSVRLQSPVPILGQDVIFGIDNMVMVTDPVPVDLQSFEID